MFTSYSYVQTVLLLQPHKFEKSLSPLSNDFVDDDDDPA